MNRLKTENRKLKERIKTNSSGGKQKYEKTCEKCCIAKCKRGSSCFAEGKKCNSCGGLSHFGRSKLCSKNKTVATRRVGDSEDSGTDESEEVKRIMAEAITVGKVENRDNKESIHCRLKVTSHDDNKFEAKIHFAMGVRKTILNRSD